VFLVVPHFPEPPPVPPEAPKRKRALNAGVRAALRALDLGEDAEFEDVRQAYREHVKLYHPDKVAHLGPDLKKVAEAKTKEFNAAYRVLERFYGE
jgi:DnaJ-domain-containing protein 1